MQFGGTSMLNPISYTERVAQDFLRYQLTAYPFSDSRLYAQMRDLLSMEETRHTPLMKGPYVSLSRLFEKGASLRQLVDEDLLHPELAERVGFDHLYGHQEEAIRAISAGDTTLVSTGTGSGKTESFLYPIISHCLRLRDRGARPGISAVIIYPMNALAQDQLERLRKLLVGTGVTFGLYIGKTPEEAGGVSGQILGPGATPESYERQLELQRESDSPLTVYPAEECTCRAEMRTPGSQPRILLTNVKQLELLLTRQKDVELFDDARLDYLVVDEAHTFSGAMGAETASLIRRLRTYCGRSPEETVCVATSATIADPESGDDKAKAFASRFFGVDAEQVTFVTEEHQEQSWAASRTRPPKLEGNPLVHLDRVLEILRKVDDANPGDASFDTLGTYINTLTGAQIDFENWRQSLYHILSQNEVVYSIADSLEKARPLQDLADSLSNRFSRPVHHAEILMWLALGAAARHNDRPLLRPVVHVFIRGVDGAVVTFPPSMDEPHLWLSAVDATEEDDLFPLDALTCTTCGQHYFSHAVSDFEFTGSTPGGGRAVARRRVWEPLTETEGGTRLLLVDRFASGLDDDALAKEDKLSPVYFCRRCGTLHDECGGCSYCTSPNDLVQLHAVQQKEDRPGKLSSCVGCGRSGSARDGRYREPARRVRAVTVSDVHVIAQSMVHHAQRKRLLVFTDNRQDAAFQAGWMRDRARRFRLRSLMAEHLEYDSISIGDLTFHLDERLDSEESLSRALIPEVWRAVRKERSGQEHEAQRRMFLRIQVLREITTGLRHRLGLEPWGRLKVDYAGLDDTAEFFDRWAPTARCSPTQLANGVATWLDMQRRSANMLFDREYKIFSRYLTERSTVIRRGYMPLIPGGPKGLKFSREPGDDSNRVRQILSEGHNTLGLEVARKWGFEGDEIVAFWADLWTYLTDETELLVKVTLERTNGKAISGTSGVYQIDADQIQLRSHRGFYRCDTCRRTFARKPPHERCPGWQCDGLLKMQPEREDDYDLTLLDEKFSMLRPREHSGQIPTETRERIEKWFKGRGDVVNVLVSTPTLELGVDIGALDSVMMRNVPPLPANYWQRVGRAGRRHRMAVNLTYAKPITHDRAYFADPLKMLDGDIEPPSFNLKNEVMVRKHVHAAVLSVLNKMARDSSGLPGPQRRRLRQTLDRCVPKMVRDYLFDANGNIRRRSFDVSPLGDIIEDHRQMIIDHVEDVFHQHWPDADRRVVARERLSHYVDDMTPSLAHVIDRLETRRDWAHEQIRRLEAIRADKGTLEREQEQLRKRCNRLLKRLKGSIKFWGDGGRRGYDDVFTYAVLAAEGFLPGYGLDTGGVTAHHQGSFGSTGRREWTIRRPLSMAVREYVPGNLIYANGDRFTPRFYHLSAQDPTSFHVDPAHEAVAEATTASEDLSMLGAQQIDGVPICDVDLPHFATISDEEDHRFQLPSDVYGYEMARHGEGRAFNWGLKEVKLRDAVRMRLVNVGPSRLVGHTDGELGFPVCLVCGDSRSPFSSDKELEHFFDSHEKRCHRRPERIAFYANIIVDALTISYCGTPEEAYSVFEALRHGAAHILEMELDDLQLLSLPHAGDDIVDMAIYDPMPGGSGLLEQIVNRWDEVWEAALGIVEDCAGHCEIACVDCLMNFRNMHYHRFLNRHVAARLLRERGAHLEFEDDIEEFLPGKKESVKDSPTGLEFLDAAFRACGFPEPRCDEEFDLGRSLGTTRAQFYFAVDSAHCEGVCVYFDDGSQGMRETQNERKRRMKLETEGIRTFTFTENDLDDPEMLGLRLQQIANIVADTKSPSDLVDDTTWYDEARAMLTGDSSRDITPEDEREPQDSPESGTDWWSKYGDWLGEDWRELVAALRELDIPAPRDILCGLLIKGKVSDIRALMVWGDEPQGVVVVDEKFHSDVSPNDIKGELIFVESGTLDSEKTAQIETAVEKHLGDLV